MPSSACGRCSSTSACRCAGIAPSSSWRSLCRPWSGHSCGGGTEAAPGGAAAHGSAGRLSHRRFERGLCPRNPFGGRLGGGRRGPLRGCQLGRGGGVVGESAACREKGGRTEGSVMAGGWFSLV